MSTESKELLMEIQNIFTDDKGWDTEESMIEDMALSRRLQKEKGDRISKELMEKMTPLILQRQESK